MANQDSEKYPAPSHLQQIIAALTEGIILIHPDGRLAWADQTALTLHGVDKLSELGGTTAGYAERFELTYLGGKTLDVAHYPMQQLLAGSVIDHATFEVTRRSDGKRWVHETRTVMLTGSDGEPDCLVVILDDETERFNAEERFERAFGANPAPAIIVRLADMRYVKVNQGFQELTGYRHTALIGRSMHEIDVLRGADRRELAVARLHAGQTIPQMEGCLLTADGREKTVLLGGQPIEIGNDGCMLFTFADLHPREQAHRALRESEERFAKAFNMAPVPMAVLALDGLRILDVNDAFTTASGWRREEIVGRTEPGIAMWGEGDLRTRVERRTSEGGEIRGLDIQFRGKNGVVRDYLLSADMVVIQGERCVLSVMLDITERKQTEIELLAAVEAAMQDTSWIGHKIVEKLASITRATDATPQRQPELDSLPGRAREVLDLLASGLSDDDVAKRLGIARNTLRNHIAVIYGKLGMHKRSAIIVWAREHGLGMPSKPHANLAKKGRGSSR